jgi:hypothetical protein
MALSFPIASDYQVKLHKSSDSTIAKK